jgi:alkylated DNA repair protein alkB family protein 6
LLHWTPSLTFLLGGTPSAVHGKMIQEPVPTWLSNPIYSRLRDIGVSFSENNDSVSEPNHVLVNEYLPGQGIMPHQDGPLYNSIVATVTLNSHSILNFYPHASNVTSTIEMSSEPEFSVLLEPRSLFIQTGQLYKTYLHGIAEVTEDDFVENPPINYDQSSTSSILHRGTRISLTYRRVKKVVKNPFAKSIFK